MPAATWTEDHLDTALRRDGAAVEAPGRDRPGDPDAPIGDRREMRGRFRTKRDSAAC